jgi:hypothetical protein
MHSFDSAAATNERLLRIFAGAAAFCVALK